MDPCQLTMSISAIASCIAKNLSDEDLELLAAVLTQLGDTLATIGVQRSRCASIMEGNNKSSSNGTAWNELTYLQ